MERDSNLKPCPFCGGEASENANLSFCEGKTYIEFSAGCKQCNVFMTYSLRMVSNTPTDNIKDAIQLAAGEWNRRVTKDD